MSRLNLTLSQFLIVCPLVFLASFVDAVGGGGGLISLPAYLVAGLPAHFASGTNKCSASFGTLLAAVRFWVGKRTSLKAALIAAACAFPGSSLGALLQCRLSEETVRAFMLVAIPLVAIFLLFKRQLPETSRPLARRDYVLCAGIGLVCGLYDGFFGPGTGTILILLFSGVLGMDMVTASGTAKLVNLSSNLAALATFALAGKVLWLLAIPATACSLVGGYLGAAMALHKGARFVRAIMLLVLALLILKLALGFFGIG